MPGFGLEESVPVEVKSSTNLQAQSLKNYIQKYSPNFAIRTSMADYKKTDNLTDLPLYAIGNAKKCVKMLK